MHSNSTDEFFSKEISNLNKGTTLRDSTIDGKVSIDSSHLVFIALKQYIHRLSFTFLTQAYHRLFGLNLTRYIYFQSAYPHYTSNVVCNDGANRSYSSEFLAFAEMLFYLKYGQKGEHSIQMSVLSILTVKNHISHDIF